MSKLSFITPQSVVDHFDVSADTTAWGGEYQQSFLGNGKTSGQTPVRNRASFHTKSRALVAKSELALRLKKQCGLYLVSFDLPYPALYIGIAAKSKKPEGILSRLQKHRIKATAAHLGSSPTNNGGMNHTRGWRSFAIDRYAYFSQRDVADNCADMKFSFGDVEISDVVCTHKKGLEYIENFIFQNNDIQKKLRLLLWPDIGSTDVYQLTSTTSRGIKPSVSSVDFWSRAGFSID